MARGGLRRFREKVNAPPAVALWKFSLAANHGISLDLKLGVKNRTRSNGDASAAGEVITKCFSADLREAIPVTYVRDEYGHLHHVAELAARLLQSAIQVLKKLPYLAVKVARQRSTIVVHCRGLSCKPHHSAAFGDYRLRIATLLWTVSAVANMVGIPC